MTTANKNNTLLPYRVPNYMSNLPQYHEYQDLLLVGLLLGLVLHF